MSNTIQSVDTIYVGYSPTQLSDLSQNTSYTKQSCDADKILNAELNYKDGVPFFSMDHALTPSQNFSVSYGGETLSLDLSNNGKLSLKNGSNMFWSACDILSTSNEIGKFNLLNSYDCSAGGMNLSGNVVVNPYCNLDQTTGNFTCYDQSIVGNSIPYIQWNMNPKASCDKTYMVMNGFSNTDYTGNITMMTNSGNILASTNSVLNGWATSNISGNFDNAHKCEKKIAETDLIKQSHDNEVASQLYQDALAIYNIQCVNRINLLIGIIGTIWYTYYLSKS